MSEFDPRYHLPRRSLTGPVITLVIAVVVGGFVLNARCEAARRAEAEYWALKATQQMLEEKVAAAGEAQRHPRPPPAPEPGPNDLPAEFELTWGETRVDVTSARVKVGDLTLELVRPRRWRLSTPRLSLTYDNAVRVAATEDGAILATASGWAHVTAGSAAKSADAAIAAIAARLEIMTSAMSSPIAAGTVAGLPAHGRRWELPDATLAVLVAEAPSSQVIVATFYGASRNADLRDLRAVVASAALEALPEMPTFVVTARDSTGRSVDKESIYLDRPLAFAGGQLVLRRRATVRARFADITFERDPSMVVIATDPDSAMLTMRSAEIGITLVTPAIEMDVAAVVKMVAASAAEPISRQFGEETFDGVTAKRYEGVETLIVEGYGFRRAGRQILTVVTYPATRRDEALRLLTPVITSAR